MPVFKPLTLYRVSKNTDGGRRFTRLVTVGATRQDADLERLAGADVEGLETATAWRTTNASAHRPANSRPGAFAVDRRRYQMLRREVDGNAVTFFGVAI